MRYDAKDKIAALQREHISQIADLELLADAAAELPEWLSPSDVCGRVGRLWDTVGTWRFDNSYGTALSPTTLVNVATAVPGEALVLRRGSTTAIQTAVWAAANARAGDELLDILPLTCDVQATEPNVVFKWTARLAGRLWRMEFCVEWTDQIARRDLQYRDRRGWREVVRNTCLPGDAIETLYGRVAGKRRAVAEARALSWAPGSSEYAGPHTIYWVPTVPKGRRLTTSDVAAHLLPNSNPGD